MKKLFMTTNLASCQHINIQGEDKDSVPILNDADKQGAKLQCSPAAGAGAPPDPAAAELATATAPPAGMLASLP